MKITVRRTITIDWDGTPEDYIRLADAISRENLGHGLDSLDCGDATGVFADPNLMIDWDDTIRDGHGQTLSRSYADENFEYDCDASIILDSL